MVDDDDRLGAAIRRNVVGGRQWLRFPRPFLPPRVDRDGAFVPDSGAAGVWYQRRPASPPGIPFDAPAISSGWFSGSQLHASNRHQNGNVIGPLAFRLRRERAAPFQSRRPVVNVDGFSPVRRPKGALAQPRTG